MDITLLFMVNFFGQRKRKHENKLQKSEVWLFFLFYCKMNEPQARCCIDMVGFLAHLLFSK